MEGGWLWWQQMWLRDISALEPSSSFFSPNGRQVPCAPNANWHIVITVRSLSCPVSCTERLDLSLWHWGNFLLLEYICGWWVSGSAWVTSAEKNQHPLPVDSPHLEMFWMILHQSAKEVKCFLWRYFYGRQQSLTSSNLIVVKFSFSYCPKPSW